MLDKIVEILTQNGFHKKQFKHTYIKPIYSKESNEDTLDLEESLNESQSKDISKSYNNNGIIKYERVEGELLPSFKNIFQDDKERELYILEEKKSMFCDEDLDKFHKEISGFITLNNNDIMNYNINLILLCPFGKSLDDRTMINKYENNKYICRKIFLNTLNKNLEEEINLLPLLRLDSKHIAIDEHEIKKSVTDILFGNFDFYEELKKDISGINIDNIKEFLLTFPKEGDDRE